MACEETTRKQRSSEILEVVVRIVEPGGLVAVFGLNAQSTAVRHQCFTGPSPPAPLRTKATTKHTDESQMSRHSSKKPSQPQRQGTHTPPMTAAGPPRRKERQREERVFLCVGK